MKNKNLFVREITVTVFLIILLSVLCVKKVKDLKILAQESISQKNEQVIREALAVYRGDNAQAVLQGSDHRQGSCRPRHGRLALHKQQAR